MVKKIIKKQPKQPNNVPDDDDILIPPGMFDTDPTPATVLATLTVNTTSDSPIKVKPTTKSTTPCISNTYTCSTNDNDNDNDNNYDDDQVVPIPPGMFDTKSIPETVLEKLAINVTSERPIKVKPSTKMTPSRVSNIYACLINDNNDKADDEEAAVNRAAPTQQVPTTGNKMISKQMDELDDNDDDINEPPALVVISDIPNTAFMRNLSTLEKIGLR